MAPLASILTPVPMQVLPHAQPTPPSLGIAIAGGVLCCVWMILFGCQHLYYRLRCSRVRLCIVGACCVLALSGWVLFILGAWLTTADHLALRYGCMGLVVGATWMLVFSMIGFVLLLRVKSDADADRSQRLDHVRAPQSRGTSTSNSTTSASASRSSEERRMDAESLVERVEAVRGEDDTCAICLENLRDCDITNVVRPLKCARHHFHKRCIVQWLSRTDAPSCPVCKRPCT